VKSYDRAADHQPERGAPEHVERIVDAHIIQTIPSEPM
jgi:hypothetical protein